MCVCAGRRATSLDLYVSIDAPCLRQKRSLHCQVRCCACNGGVLLFWRCRHSLSLYESSSSSRCLGGRELDSMSAWRHVACHHWTAFGAGCSFGLRTVVRNRIVECFWQRMHVEAGLCASAVCHPCTLPAGWRTGGLQHVYCCAHCHCHVAHLITWSTGVTVLQPHPAMYFRSSTYSISLSCCIGGIHTCRITGRP